MSPTITKPALKEINVKPPMPFFRVPKSGWAVTPPSISGSFVPAEWQNAGIVTLPQMGFLMLKNDLKYLYVALDVVQDTIASPGVDDSFWLSFDVDGNAAITTQKDVNYGIYPTLPIRIGRQFYLGKAVWTGILTDPSSSLACQYFGVTPASNTPHRIWLLRIELAEIGVDFAKLSGPPKIRFGLQLFSSTPGFARAFPDNFINDFSHLMEAFLATAPALPATKGLPMAGVGLIPVGNINLDGRATTDPTYFINAKNAAFGGVVNIIADENMMRNLYNNLDVRSYRIKVQMPDGSFTDIRQSWNNYRFTANGPVLETFGPDLDGKYKMWSPNETYSIDHLLFQWNTYGFASGLYELSVEFFNSTGTPVNVFVPKTNHLQQMPIFVDNNLPDVRILDVRYKNQPVPACAIVKVTDTPDPVQLEIRAFDPEGNLFSYRLDAFYGENAFVVPPLAQGNYPGTGNWQGVTQTVISAPATGANKFPPTTCAYEFRLSATPRVTNGYDYIGYTEARRHVTFERSAAPHVLNAKFTREFPAGMDATGKVLPNVKPIK